MSSSASDQQQQNEDLIKQFVQITSSSEAQAKFYLNAANNDLQKATALFYENKPKVTGLTDFKKDESNKYFTGGKQSGTFVEGNDDVVGKILKQAAENGAKEFSEKEEKKPRAFGGTGFKLGSNEQDQSAAVEASEEEEESEPETEIVTRHLTFWRNGFSIEDGELMKYDDEHAKKLLEMINSGRAPLDLFGLKFGQRADVRVAHRRGEDYVAPKKKTVPFQGSGQRLGSVVPGGSNSSTTVATSSSTSTTNFKASPQMSVDPNLPSTSIQIRLADGTRLVAKFNTTHRLSDIRQFIKLSRHDERNFQLQTQFPVKLLDAEDKTIEELGLQNAVIMQKYI